MNKSIQFCHNAKIQGVKFNSVQREGGENIVLFSNEGADFPIEWVKDSLKEFKTESIEYTHFKTKHLGKDADQEFFF